jgi:hypothetical protein
MGEPEAAAPATAPLARLVMPTPAVKASAASPSLPLCLPDAFLIAVFLPRKCPDAKSGT